ncbi:ATP-binding protein [Psychrobacter sp. SMN/5/1215-MNA-CIBAN-0208]|uniref:ATP-binding protein n=1 Tax=Psychrobacter sp. SMN/5/1215-MNA-CIBAN-0208 TaxID=3140442 RepID=UPI003333BA94
MEIIKELSRVEFGSVLLRELIIDCSTHGQTKHRDVNGSIECCKCNDAKINKARDKRLKIDSQNMKALMTTKMISKGVSLNKGSFSDWQYDETKNTEQRDKIAQLQQYSESINSHTPNLIILGRTGTGKTMLANAIAINQYLRKEQSLPSEFDSYNQQDFYNHTCELITSFNIGSQVRACWGNSQKSEDDYLRKLVANELLIIDDLGAGDGHAKDRERIAQIINLRYKKAPTLITTNLDIDDLSKYLGDRAWDRLSENVLVMICDWDSYRAKNAVIKLVGSAK